MTSKMTTPPMWLYDTTLRDGTQGEGINFSCEDKLRIARKLDDLGIHYIEGGWPGSNPKDIEFFQRAQIAQAQDGGAQQEILNAFSLLFQHFFNQVIQNKTMAAGKRFDAIR